MKNLNKITQLCFFCLLSLVFNVAYSEPTLKLIDGTELPISHFKGQWVVINYWASWCAPCQHEIPELNKFYLEHKKINTVLFAVNYDGVTLNEQRSLASQFKLLYPSLGQDPSAYLGFGDIRGIPATFVINPEGKLVKTLYGEQTAKSLAKVVQS